MPKFEITQEVVSERRIIIEAADQKEAIARSYFLEDFGHVFTVEDSYETLTPILLEITEL